MKSTFSKGLLVALGLSAALVASAMDPVELSGMRSKAVRGNVLAQYNLGTYYSNPSNGGVDRAEAYSWLKLASENGAGSIELTKLTEDMSPAELSEGRKRFEDLRLLMQPSAASPALATPVVDAVSTQQRLLSERDKLAASLKTMAAELAALKEAQAKAGGAPDKLRTELNKLADDLNEARQAASQFAVKNQQLEDTASERGRALEKAQAELAQAQVALKAKTDSLAAALAEAAAVEQARAAEMSSVASESKTLEVQAPSVADNSAVLTALRAELADLSAEKNQLGQELADAKAQLAHARADADQLVGLQAEIEALRSQSGALAAEQARASEATAKLAEVNAVVAELQQQLKLASHSDELARMQERMAALEQMNMDYSARANAAEGRAAALESNTDMETLRSQLAESEMKLAAALRSYTVQQEENDQGREHAAQLHADLEQRYGKLEAERAELAAQLQAETSLRQDKEAQLATATAEASAAKQSSQNFGNEAAGLKDQLRQTQAQLTTVLEENAQLKTKFVVQSPGPGGAGLGTPTRPGLPALSMPAAGNAAVGLGETAAVVAPAKEAVAEPAEPVVIEHIIAAGDSLSKIARKYYGSSARWNDIYEANRLILSNPAKLPIGAKLRIP